MDSSKLPVLILAAVLILAGAGNGIAKLTRKEIGGLLIIFISLIILYIGLIYCEVI